MKKIYIYKEKNGAEIWERAIAQIVSVREEKNCIAREFVLAGNKCCEVVLQDRCWLRNCIAIQLVG